MKYPEDFINKIICGNNIDIIKNIRKESIDLIITSPPYDEIRDYCGYKLDLHILGEELYRILKEGSCCIFVMQDGTKNFRKSLTTFKTCVDYCENIGFNLFECCIYKKQGRPGAWWNYRFRVDHEYILIFFKGNKLNYFNKNHLSKIVGLYSGGGTTRTTSGICKKIEKIKQYNTKSQGTIFDYKNSSLAKENLYKLKLQHPATYPNKLVEDFIKCFSQKNEDIVLDPFCGSGTSCVVAKFLGKNYIGIDISEKYCTLSREILKRSNMKNNALEAWI